MPNSATTALANILPDLSTQDLEQLERLTKNSRQIELPRGQSLFHEGDVCDRYLIVTSGSLRVQKVNPTGHEIVLHHVHEGEQCNLTNTCLLGGHHYPADAVAEMDTKVALLSRSQFHKILEVIPGFREIVFKEIKHSVTDLVDLVEEVAFDHMDHRVASLLIKRADESDALKATHQELAAELGSAREVVSRILKNFEHHHWVKLHRGMIELTDRQQLSRI
ncbi:Crp/Fnr family transcriptional regulator [Pseudomonadota bacterium]